jgi:hypothetical protein
MAGYCGSLVRTVVVNGIVQRGVLCKGMQHECLRIPPQNTNASASGMLLDLQSLLLHIGCLLGYTNVDWTQAANSTEK